MKTLVPTKRTIEQKYPNNKSKSCLEHIVVDFKELLKKINV
jgi:hypothetical protein